MIYPVPTDIPQVLPRRAPLSAAAPEYPSVRIWSLKLHRVWSAANISYRGGQYSVERLLALDEYTRSTSVSRVVLVIGATFLPSQMLVICQEAVPLQDPALGWRANYGFWVRLPIVIAAVLYTVLVQARYFLKRFVISRSQLILLIAISVTGQTIVAMLFAANLWFPIPFIVITLVPGFYVLSTGSTCLVAGMPIIREVLKNKDRLVRFGSFIAAQQLMALIYPAYQVLFHATHSTQYGLVVILLLPVIKIVMKNIALRCVAHMEDMMPEAVIFTVDFFNALYISTCMESTTSTSTVVVIVLVDIAQSVTVLLGLNRRTASVLRRVTETSDALGSADNLFGAACHLCKSVDTFRWHTRQRIRHRTRIQSCISHNVSGEVHELLKLLHVASRTGSLHAHRHRSAPLSRNELAQRVGKCWAERQLQRIISPVQITYSPKVVGCPQTSNSDAAQPRTGVLSEALEVLFTTECLLLSAFLDAFVPLFYGSFMLVMIHLPSAEYHSELVGVTTETIGDAVDSIFVFAIVELVSFGLLAAMIHRNLGINALYHLAFVLETQTELIQSKLLAWVTMTLAFRVAHFGINFTFKFAWLKNTK